jgi:hypothetical protein
MRSLLIAAAIVLASAGAGFAEDTTPVVVPDALAPTIGNTVVVVDAKGIESHTWFAADGTFSGIAPAYNYPFKGTWTITADGQLCRTFDPAPPGIVNPVCSPLEAHAVGDKWTDKDGGTATIVAGKQ